MSRWMVAACLCFTSVLAVGATAVSNKFEEVQAELRRYAALKHSRANFVANFVEMDKRVNTLFRELKALERDAEMSPQGNSLAYDIELLEPLRYLAASTLSAADCNRAEHLARLNGLPDPEPTTVADTTARVFQAVCGRRLSAVPEIVALAPPPQKKMPQMPRSPLCRVRTSNPLFQKCSLALQARISNLRILPS